VSDPPHIAPGAASASGRRPASPSAEPETGPALGRDPFAEEPGSEALVSRLDALERRRPRRRPKPRAPAADAPQPDLPQGRARGPSHPRTPALAEVELPEESDFWDRLLPERARRALSATSHLVEGEAATDRFGFSPETARKALPWFHALYRGWFRTRSRGHEHLPERGGAVLASNHAGLLPFDAAMTVVDVLMHTDPPRLARAVVDRWAGELPFVNIFYARVGQVVGTHENFAELLEDEQLVLVFPEGAAGVTKPLRERYRLQDFHVGFVEHALRGRVPIVPMAVVGSDDQAPMLFDLKPLARALGMPAVPITPTFPWLGPLGLLPLPVRYRIVYGEPLDFHERFGPEGAEDARLVHYLAAEVRRAVGALIESERG